jgi:hypothetical protein
LPACSCQPYARWWSCCTSSARTGSRRLGLHRGPRRPCRAPGWPACRHRHLGRPAPHRAGAPLPGAGDTAQRTGCWQPGQHFKTG